MPSPTPTHTLPIRTQVSLSSRRGGNGYEGGGQREHRGKGEGAQEEAAPEALVGYYEYGYAENIVQYTCKVNVAEVYAEILRQHGPQKLGIAHKAGSVEVPRRGKYVYAYGHYDAAQGGYYHTAGKGAHGIVVHTLNSSQSTGYIRGPLRQTGYIITLAILDFNSQAPFPHLFLIKLPAAAKQAMHSLFSSAADNPPPFVV